MTEWTPGMACRIAEHDEEAGRSYPAVVLDLSGHPDADPGAVYAEPLPGHGWLYPSPLAFDPQTGRAAYDAGSRWRLLPGARDAATAAGGTGPRGASMNHGASFPNGPGGPRWMLPGLRPVTIWDFMEWRPYE